MRNPSRADIAAHALAIRLDAPLPAGYPHTGRAWPSARVVSLLRKADWPVEIISALLPSARESHVRQPVAVVPLVWLEELARRLGCDLGDVCRGTVPDAEQS